MKWTTYAAALAIVFSANFADAGLFGHHKNSGCCAPARAVALRATPACACPSEPACAAPCQPACAPACAAPAAPACCAPCDPGCAAPCGPACAPECAAPCGPACDPGCAAPCGPACDPGCAAPCSPACAPSCCAPAPSACCAPGEQLRTLRKRRRTVWLVQEALRRRTRMLQQVQLLCSGSELLCSGDLRRSLRPDLCRSLRCVQLIDNYTRPPDEVDSETFATCDAIPTA